MVSNSRFLIKLFLVIILSFNSTTFATTMLFPKLSVIKDEALVEWSTNIVEGKVIEILQKNQGGSNHCFEYIYKLQISDVMKGDAGVGEVINIGLPGYIPTIYVGQKQFVLVGDPVSEFYSSCKLGNLPATVEPESIKINSSGKASIYIVAPQHHGNEEKFNLMRCGNDTVMFQDSKDLFLERSIFEGKGFECDVYVGDYNALKRDIKDLIRCEAAN